MIEYQNTKGHWLLLTDLEVSHFKVFGYVVVRGCVDREHVERLQKAFDREIDNNPRVEQASPGGTRSLHPFAETDEAFTELIEHPKLMEAMRDIDGIEFLYQGEDMIGVYRGAHRGSRSAVS